MDLSIILMAGLPGTGKSFAAKHLADVLGSDLYSDLDIRREMGHKKHDRTKVHLVDAELHRRIEDSLQAGRNVIYERANRKVDSRRPSYDIAKRNYAQPLTIECKCSEEEAKRRMRKRPGSDGLVVPPKDTRVYDYIAERWESILLDVDGAGQLIPSYIQYDSEEHKVYEVSVKTSARELVDEVTQVLLELGK